MKVLSLLPFKCLTGYIERRRTMGRESDWEIFHLNEKASDLETQISRLEDENSELKSQVEDLSDRISKLESYIFSSSVDGHAEG